jgi:hypothetical protein
LLILLFVKGKIGRNGQLTGREDLDRLDTPEFEPFRDPLLGDYTNQTVEAFMKTVPKRGIDVITMRDKAEERAYKQALIDLKKTNQFSNLNIRNMSGTTPISVKYVPETIPDPQDANYWNSSRSNRKESLENLQLKRLLIYQKSYRLL